MKMTVSSPIISLTLTCCLIITSYFFICVASELTKVEYKMTRIFPVETNQGVKFNSSIIASPLLVTASGKPYVIVPVSDGHITVLDGKTGQLIWQITLPAPVNQEAQLIATPLILKDKLFVVYQCLEKNRRVSHRLVVIDLKNKKIDSRFPVLEFNAEKTDANGRVVEFNPATAFSHAALKQASLSDSSFGYLYVAFGNAGDEQPYHGWLFEVDIDAWWQQGEQKAIKNVLLTTPEADCPVTVQYGTQEMICGGGIWAPAGIQIYPTKDRFELVVPTGNGQIDLVRRDYANTLMRLSPGLDFDPACDAKLCKNFDPIQPNEDCMTSCKNLFIPRLASGNTALKPSNHECDDKSFSECLAWMDYDLGGSSPIKVHLESGHTVLVQAGKDGAVYLLDAHQLGIQYDRLPIVAGCGSDTDNCKAGWMGMIVTQPALTYINKTPVLIVPTFVPDQSHPAGVIALKIVLQKGKPALKRVWQVPESGSPEALTTFRSHPSFPVISTLKGDAVVWVVDIGQSGTLYGIRIKDGTVLTKQSLLGAGRQLSHPLIYNDMIYLASILPTTGKAFIEAYHIELENR